MEHWDAGKRAFQNLTPFTLNGLIIEFTFVMPAKAGIQALFQLVTGFHRKDNIIGSCIVCGKLYISQVILIGLFTAGERKIDFSEPNSEDRPV